MPKSAKAPQSQKEDAPLLASKGTIVTALIAAAGVVLAAIIGLASKWIEKPLPSEEKKLIVKVVDKNNGQAIGGAKVSLEASGVFAVNSTDSDGVISFLIADPKKELRLRVEADGYNQNFNLRIIPANIVGAQEIKLTPLAKPSPITTPAIPAMQPFMIPSVGFSSVLRGQVVDELGAAVPVAQVTVTGYGSTVLTNEAGNFQIRLPVGNGKIIDLHVSKDGFRTRTQKHIINNDSARIMLRRLSE